VAAALRDETEPASEVRLLDAATGRERAALQGDAVGVECLAFRPDGAVLATGHDQGWGGGGWIKLWDAATGRELATLWGHQTGLEALLYSADGRRLFSASQTEVKVWDPVSEQELLTLPSGWGLQLSADGRTLATGADRERGSEVRLWRAASAEEVRAWEERRGQP
jgi:WD40 repeat protein